mmetsp:Transcript_71870/g.208153  ORF Transcript_71870/g.208153 Transcript_71870/m.208153 type:complete len:215 (+) Transcript_71870:669-1313(+)
MALFGEGGRRRRRGGAHIGRPPCRPLGLGGPRRAPADLRAHRGAPGISTTRAPRAEGGIAVPVLRRFRQGFHDVRHEPIFERHRILLNGLRRRAGRRALGGGWRGRHYGLHGHRDDRRGLLPHALRALLPPGSHRRRSDGRLARDLRVRGGEGGRRGFHYRDGLSVYAARHLHRELLVALPSLAGVRHPGAGERLRAADEVPGDLVPRCLRLAP